MQYPTDRHYAGRHLIQAQVPEQDTDGSSWKAALIVGMALVVIDGFVLYQGILTLLFVFGLALGALPRLLLQQDREARVDRLRNLGIYACAVVLVFVINEWNVTVSRERADAVVKAVHQFHDRHQRYPDRLTELVPEFLPELPVVRYSIPSRAFEYRHATKGPQLQYAAAPPFTRPTYDFASGKWTDGVAIDDPDQRAAPESADL